MGHGFFRTALTGGGANAIDGIDGVKVSDQDIILAMVSNILYIYEVDADSAATESSPDVIAFDANGGDNRAVLKAALAGTGISKFLGDITIAGALTATTLDTGQGANELYDMDQNVLTSSKPSFAGLTLTADADGGGYYFTQLQNIPDLASRGPAYWFDGVNDKITTVLAAGTDLDFGTGDFSYVVNGRPLITSGYDYFLGINEDGNNLLNLNFNPVTNKIQWYMSTGGVVLANYITTSAAYTIGQWLNIAVVADRDDAIYIYKDGQTLPLTENTALSSSDLDINALFTIGSNGGAEYSNVEISRTLAFNLALTAAEVKALSSGAEVPYKYVGASQTSIVTGTDSDFSGANNWVDDNLTSFDNTTGGVLTLAGDNGAKCHLPIANATTIIGKRYRLSFTVDSITAQWRTWEDAATTSWTIAPSTTGFHSVEFTATTIGGIWIRSDADGNAIVIDNITLTQIGCVLNLNPSGIGHNTWADSGGNELHGTVSGALPTALPSNHREKYIDLAVTGDTSFVLPKNYIINAIVLTSDGAIGGGIDIGTSDGGGEIVTAQAIAGAGTVLCTLVAGANYNTTGADDTIYITDADATGWDGATVAVRVQMERIALN